MSVSGERLVQGFADLSQIHAQKPLDLPIIKADRDVQKLAPPSFFAKIFGLFSKTVRPQAEVQMEAHLNKIQAQLKLNQKNVEKFEKEVQRLIALPDSPLKAKRLIGAQIALDKAKSELENTKKELVTLQKLSPAALHNLGSAVVKTMAQLSELDRRVTSCIAHCPNLVALAKGIIDKEVQKVAPTAIPQERDEPATAFYRLIGETPSGDFRKDLEMIDNCPFDRIAPFFKTLVEKNKKNPNADPKNLLIITRFLHHKLEMGVREELQKISKVVKEGPAQSQDLTDTQLERLRSYVKGFKECLVEVNVDPRLFPQKEGMLAALDKLISLVDNGGFDSAKAYQEARVNKKYSLVVKIFEGLSWTPINRLDPKDPVRDKLHKAMLENPVVEKLVDEILNLENQRSRCHRPEYRRTLSYRIFQLADIKPSSQHVQKIREDLYWLDKLSNTSPTERLMLLKIRVNYHLCGFISKEDTISQATNHLQLDLKIEKEDQSFLQEWIKEFDESALNRDFTNVQKCLAAISDLPADVQWAILKGLHLKGRSPAIWNHFLPLLAKLYASGQRDNLITFLQQVSFVNTQIPLFKAFTTSDLILIMEKTDSSANLLTDFPEFNALLVDQLKSASPAELMALITKKKADGKTLFYHPHLLKAFLPLIKEKIPQQQYRELFLQKDAEGNTPLHMSDNFPNFLALCPTPPFTREDVMFMLQTKNNNSKTALQKIGQVESFSPEALKFLGELDLANFFVVIREVSPQGQTPLHGTDTLAQLQPLIATRLATPDRQEVIKQVLSILDKISLSYSKKEYLANFVLTLKQCDQSVDQILARFQAKDSNGKTSLHNAEIFEFVCTELKPTVAQLTEILKIKTPHGLTSEKHLKTLFEYLKQNNMELPPDCFADLMVSPNQDGSMPLDLPTIRNDQVARLKALPANETMKILETWTRAGKGLHLTEDSDFIFKNNLIAKADDNSLLRMLRMTYPKDDIPLLFRSLIPDFWPYVQKLLQNHLELFQMQHPSGATVLHKISGISSGGITLPILTIPRGDLHQLRTFANALKIKDSKGNTPLHYKENFLVLLPYLKHLAECDPGEFRLLLKERNNEGDTILRYVENFKMILPYVQNHLSPDDCLNLLSIPNADGKTPLHSPGNVAIWLKNNPALNRGGFRPFNKLVEALLVRDNNGHTPLHDPVIFNKLYPGLYQAALRDPSLMGDFKKLFKGTGFLANTECLKMALPFLKTLSLAELGPILQDQSTTGKTVLHVPANVSLLKQHLPQLDFSRILPALTTPDKSGNIPLDNPKVFSECFDTLCRLPPEEFSAVLLKGKSILTHLENFKKVWPIRDRMPPEVFKTLLKTKDSEGKTPLHVTENLKLLAQSDPPKPSYLSQLNNAELVKFFQSVPDLLHNPANFSLVAPLFYNLSGAQIVELLLTMKEKNGDTFWHNQENCVLLNGLLKEKFKTPADKALLAPLKDVQDKKGNTLIHGPLLHLYKTLGIEFLDFYDSPPGEPHKYFQVRNKRGETPLHYKVLFDFTNCPANHILALYTQQDNFGNTPFVEHRKFLEKELAKVSNEQLFQMLQEVDEDGNTVWHRLALNQKYCAFILARLTFTQKHKLDQIPNKMGITVAHLSNLSINESWLVKSKKSTKKASISLDEYSKKVTPLINQLSGLLESADANFLMGYSKNKVKGALKTFFDRLANKTSWLGTPPPDKHGQAGELHQFYCEMVENLEEILQHLKALNDPEVTASCLLGIARAELEGRCAAAYQAETQQVKDRFDEAGQSVEQMVEKSAKAVLQGIIENLINIDHNSNVHAYNQFSYAVGLASAPDHLASVSVLTAQKDIRDRWSVPKIMFETSPSLNTIPKELLLIWFAGQKIPTSFQPEVAEQIEIIEKLQNAGFEKVKVRMREEGIADPAQQDKLIKMMSTSSFGKHELRANYNPSSIHGAVEGMPESLQKQALKEALKNEDDVEKLKGLLAEVTPKIDKQPNGMPTSASVQKKRDFLLNVEEMCARNTLRKALKKEFPQAPEALIEKMMLIKITFDREMRAIPEQVQKPTVDADGKEKPGFVIDYSPSENGIPSAALVEQRKKAYANMMFRGNTLKPFAAISLLQQAGVLNAAAAA